MTSHAFSCDIFCAVIDNLGDAGVCWRLARQLAIEHAWQVRLWIDDQALLERLVPDCVTHPVAIRHWTDDAPLVSPADVVIEAFACALPPRYVAAMRDRRTSPVWINLEYLSAEDWIIGCHGLPSPQARLTKHFFFPGFVPGTGGLIRERDCPVPPVTGGSPCGTPTIGDTLDVSLFCYDNPSLPTLLDAWRDGDQAICCHVCAGLPQKQVARWLDEPFMAGAVAHRGQLELTALSFLPQTAYDALLSRCHLNFVRGEDSFVRAQWMERPFVWQAYPQDEDAHLAKLEAYLTLRSLPATAADFFRAWNGTGTLDWKALASTLPTQAASAGNWARRIEAPGDLAGNLVKFCLARL